MCSHDMKANKKPLQKIEAFYYIQL
jgi:hypothetical protein